MGGLVIPLRGEEGPDDMPFFVTMGTREKVTPQQV